MEVLLAEYGADTLIVKTALRYGLARAFGKIFPQNSFLGCDTVINIYGFRKVQILKKLGRESAPEEIFQSFNSLRVTTGHSNHMVGMTILKFISCNCPVSITGECCVSRDQ